MADEYRKYLGKAMELRRRELNMRQEALGDLCGRAQGTVSQMERGGNVSMETFLRVARSLAYDKPSELMAYAEELRERDRTRNP